ncbi:MAG: hypothetical protein H0V78_12975 [Burkholderiales bacterium]|nr:hypothetical protein [Burkholderiales bacterium]
MLDWHIAARDCRKTAEARFAGEQIVIGVVEPQVADVVADREKLAFLAI